MNVQSAAGLALFTLLSASAAAQECSVSIVNPKGGQIVNEDANVDGKAAIPPGRFLWLFSHRKGLQLWWPQGGGAATISKDGKWQIVVTFGTERDVGREFEVAAVVVDSDTNERLRAWVTRAEETGRYPGIQLPSAVSGCRIADITVTKSR